MEPGYYSDQTSKTSGNVFLDIEWTSAATGGVPALSTFAQHAGVTSVTRDSSGTYTVVLDESATHLLAFGGSILQASFLPAGPSRVQITANSVAVPGTRSFSFKTVAGDDGDVADMAAGDVITLNLRLQTFNASP